MKATEAELQEQYRWQFSHVDNKPNMAKGHVIFSHSFAYMEFVATSFFDTICEGYYSLLELENVR